MQLRMRPQIASLTRLFYNVNLKDHPCVEAFPHVKGVGKDVFFLTHKHLETKTTLESNAKVTHLLPLFSLSDLTHVTSLPQENAFEAHFCVKFARFLCQQGYAPNEITILTPYLGQRRKIKYTVDNEEYFKSKKAIPVIVTGTQSILCFVCIILSSI